MQAGRGNVLRDTLQEIDIERNIAIKTIIIVHNSSPSFFNRARTAPFVQPK